MLGLQFCGLTGLVILAANLLKYVHVLKIEGEIALLSLECNNFYTAQYRRTHRKKDLYALCAVCITLKRIISSAYIFFFLCSFEISYQDINFCPRFLGRLEKIEGQ